jgi:hypothetical protein
MKKARKWRFVTAGLHLLLFSVTWLLAWLQPQPLMDGPADLPFTALLIGDLPLSLIPWAMWPAPIIPI